MQTGICNSKPAHMRQTHDQKYYTISDVAELMISFVVHYMAIYCPHQQTVRPAVQHAYIPVLQSATLCLHLIACKLLIISHPTKNTLAHQALQWHINMTLTIAVDIIQAAPRTNSSTNFVGTTILGLLTSRDGPSMCNSRVTRHSSPTT